MGLAYNKPNRSTNATVAQTHATITRYEAKMKHTSPEIANLYEVAARILPSIDNVMARLRLEAALTLYEQSNSTTNPWRVK
jgi:hypothetical protein